MISYPFPTPVTAAAVNWIRKTAAAIVIRLAGFAQSPVLSQSIVQTGSCQQPANAPAAYCAAKPSITPAKPAGTQNPCRSSTANIAP